MKKTILAFALSGFVYAASADMPPQIPNPSSGNTKIDAFKLVKENGCLSCHNIMGRKLAPAFMGVARRNIRFYGADAKQHIINSIENGSKGKYRMFANSQMPSYKYLGKEKITAIADWILQEYEKRKDYLPKHHNGNCQGHGNGMGGGRGGMMHW
jgi:cytochrome c551/c552